MILTSSYLLIFVGKKMILPLYVISLRSRSSSSALAGATRARHTRVGGSEQLRIGCTELVNVPFQNQHGSRNVFAALSPYWFGESRAQIGQIIGHGRVISAAQPVAVESNVCLTD